MTEEPKQALTAELTVTIYDGVKPDLWGQFTPLDERSLELVKRVMAVVDELYPITAVEECCEQIGGGHSTDCEVALREFHDRGAKDGE